MNFFSDTNVAIAYTVVHDKYHVKAKNFIDNHFQDNIFWSNLVSSEYEGVFEDIMLDIDNFFDIVEDCLKNNHNDFVSYYDFENLLLEKTKACNLDEPKKRNIIRYFWDKNNFIEGISTILWIKFINFRQDFDKLYFSRDQNLKNIMKLHNCGENNYLKYLNYTLKLKSWGVHAPDYKILVDAHDCAIKYGDLIFVSADGIMFEALNNHDVSFLKIMEFKSLN